MVTGASGLVGSTLCAILEDVGHAAGTLNRGHAAGTLNRPALRRLLVDIAAGKVDHVVAYSLDRLTRSLPDQARLFARLRCHRVMLVTVSPVVFHDPSGKTIQFGLLAALRSARRKRRRAIGHAASLRRRGTKGSK